MSQPGHAPPHGGPDQHCPEDADDQADHGVGRRTGLTQRDLEHGDEGGKHRGRVDERLGRQPVDDPPWDGYPLTCGFDEAVVYGRGDTAKDKRRAPR